MSSKRISRCSRSNCSGRGAAQTIGGRVVGGGLVRPSLPAGTGGSAAALVSSSDLISMMAVGAELSECQAHTQVGHVGGHCLPSLWSAHSTSSPSGSKPVVFATTSATAKIKTKRHTLRQPSRPVAYRLAAAVAAATSFPASATAPAASELARPGPRSWPRSAPGVGSAGPAPRRSRARAGRPSPACSTSPTQLAQTNRAPIRDRTRLRLDAARRLREAGRPRSPPPAGGVFAPAANPARSCGHSLRARRGTWRRRSRPWRP